MPYMLTICFIKERKNEGRQNVKSILEHDHNYAVCTFTRSVLYNGIQHGDFGLLPSSDPRRGQVMCVYPPMQTYDHDMLAVRAWRCMMHRYHYMNTGILWPQIDDMGKKCGYMDRYILPRATRVPGQYYQSYKGLQDFWMGWSTTRLDEKFMMDELVRKIRCTYNKDAFILRILNLKYTQDRAPWLRLWTDNNYEADYILDLMRNRGEDMVYLIDKNIKAHEEHDKRCDDHTKAQRRQMLRENC